MPLSPLKIAGTVGLAAALSVGVVACGSDSKTSTSSSGGSTNTTMMESPTTMAASLTSANFGPGCAAVPTSGAGSFSGMAADPAATAASNNPALSTLVKAVTAAGLGDTLNGAGPFTIFAPTNDAFAKIPAATLNSVLADPSGALTKILTYHVIAGTEKTVEGSEVKIAKSGDTIEINGTSAVVCGNVKVGNGTVQIIDTVLMPPGM
jgi:uncharacterized surface protein with fasciclin (FAS1) repeats